MALAFMVESPQRIEACHTCGTHILPVNCSTCDLAIPAYNAGVDCQPAKGIDGDDYVMVQCSAGDPNKCTKAPCLDSTNVTVWAYCENNGSKSMQAFKVCCQAG